MPYLNKNKFLNYYFPKTLSVILIVVIVFAYLTLNQLRIAQAVYVQQDQVTGTTTGNQPIGSYSGNQYVASPFTAGSSYTLTQVVLRMAKLGSPTFTMTTTIYTDSANAPGTVVGIGSGSIAASSLGTTEADVTFTGLNASITLGTKYWIAVGASATQDASNDVLWYSFGAAATDITTSSSNGSAWSPYDTFAKAKLTTFSGTAIADTTPPTIPTNLTATAISTSAINLSWTASTDNIGVTGYRIYRCQGVSCIPSVQVATSPANSYSDTGLSASTTYVYTIAAYDAAGNVSSQSISASATTQATPPPDTTPPTIPTNLTATAISTSAINLSWTASTDPDNTPAQISYKVFQNGSATPIATTTAGTTTYSDTGLTASTLYTYTVQAQDPALNTSAQSAPTSATTQASTPGVITASNCTAVAVQAAIDVAVSGNTVVIPAGTCTWTSSISISKGITLQGAGQDTTVITASNTDLITVTGNGTAFRMTGIGFNGSNLFGAIMIDGSFSTFRMDHLKFTNLTNRAVIIGYNNSATAIPPVYGLLDNITYVGSACNPFVLHYGKDVDAWTQNDNWGSNQAMYLEDSTFTWNVASSNAGCDVWDQEHGARAVIRHNTITNGGIWGHDTGSTQQSRGLRIKELYSNKFVCSQSGGAPDCGYSPMDFRGGSYLTYDNTIPIYTGLGPAGWEYANSTELWRVVGTQGTPPGTSDPWNFKCTDPQKTVASDFRSHCSGSPYSACGLYESVGQVCSVQTCGGGTCGTCVNNPTNVPAGVTILSRIDGIGAGNYACRDQVGQGKDSADHTTQAFTPAYWWNNTNPNSANTPITYLNVNPGPPTEATYIKSNRDVFLTDVANCAAGGLSCTKGVGRGTLAQRPGNCSNADFPGTFPGPGYFATDTNTLYRCTSPNTWATYYTAYTYPHPLQGTPLPPDTIPPTVPTNLTATAISSSQINLSWTASTDNIAVTGYKIFRGGVQVATSATTSYSDTGLTASTLYSYTVSAYDAAGNNSALSISASATTLAVSAPIISAITSSSITPTGATIAWTTDQSADTQVEYGLTTAYGSATTLDATLIISHSQVLSSLTGSTLYHYRVKSKNAGGLLTTSADNTFTTTIPPDITPPVLSAISASGVAAFTATINWTTDELSDSQVEFGTTTCPCATNTPLVATLVITHGINLSGLLPNTIYFYRVKSKDAASNLATSTTQSFTTTNAPDITPPVLSAITASGITSANSTITWTTNESSDSQVEYGLTTAYGSSTVLNASLVISHSQVLSGLVASTLYHYRVKSKDASLNLATSGDFTFTTTAIPDIIPPTVSLTAPINNSIVSGMVAVSATATDNIAVAGVQFKLDGVNLSTEVTIAPYAISWNSNTVLDGNHILTAVARDSAGNTATSTAVMVTVRNTIPPPVISAVNVSSITPTGAAITWTTDKPSTSKVNYGLSSTYNTSTVKDTTLVTSHSVTLGSLTPSTIYHFQVESTDTPNNLTSVSTDQTFTTIAALLLPVISNISSTNITISSATITWTSDIAANTQVDYGLTTVYGIQTTLDSALVQSHTVSLVGLLPSTIYHYRVRSGGSISIDQIFSTLSIADTIPPAAVTNLMAANPTTTSVTLSWTAPGNDGLIGTAASYEMRSYILPITDSNWNTATTLSGLPTPLIAGTPQTYIAIGLTPDTTYYFALKTRDQASNISPLSNVAMINTLKPTPTPTPVSTGGGGGGGGGYIPPTFVPLQQVKISRLVEADSQIIMEWTNPTVSFGRVRIIQKVDSQPTSLTDGINIFEGSGTKFVADRLLNSRDYYFAFYTIGLDGTFSVPMIVKGTPKAGVNSFPEKALPLDIAKTTSYIPPVANPVTYGPSIVPSKIFPSGSLLRYVLENKVYYIDNGQTRLISSPTALNKLTKGDNSKIIILSNKDSLSSYAPGSPVVLKDISNIKPVQSVIVKTKDSPSIYLIDRTSKIKRPIPDLATFYSYGITLKNVATLFPTELNTYTQGNPLAFQYLPNGSLIRASGSPKLYLIQDNQKRYIKSSSLLKAYKLNAKNTIIIPKEVFDKYQNGADLTRAGENINITPEVVKIKTQ